jgi:hypothetical protein
MTDRRDSPPKDWTTERASAAPGPDMEYRPTLLVCPKDSWSEVFDGPPDTVVLCPHDGTPLIPYAEPPC